VAWPTVLLLTPQPKFPSSSILTLLRYKLASSQGDADAQCILALMQDSPRHLAELAALDVTGHNFLLGMLADEAWSKGWSPVPFLFTVTLLASLFRFCHSPSQRFSRGPAFCDGCCPWRLLCSGVRSWKQSLSCASFALLP
jgi:hypothetical protein